MTDTLRVVSLNCWGLKVISKLRHARLAQIGVELAESDPSPEIVGLQECWTQEDFEAIHKATRSILPYGKFYYNGCFGAGLAILSKWPIEESSMIPYKLNGRPTAFYRGDWYVGKGIACATIRPNEETSVDVYCTHLHASYEKEPNDSYLCHRTAQAWEIAKVMRRSYNAGNLVLALGDFNMYPLSLAHNLISTYGCADDIWRLKYPDSSLGNVAHEAEAARKVTTPTARYNLQHNGVTGDSILNTWHLNKGKKRQALSNYDDLLEEKDPDAKRLDYIFLGDSRGNWSVDSVEVGMTSRHPALGCSLSDHFSIETTLSCRKQIEKPKSVMQTIEYPPNSIYDSIITMTESYKKREISERKWRLRHFMLSLCISVGCLIAVWWSPNNYVAFILVLLSTLNIAAGVIDGLIGGLFMSLELRALKEFEWEIRNARALATSISS